MSTRKTALTAILVFAMPLACWKSGMTPGGGLRAGSLDRSGTWDEVIAEVGGLSQQP